MTPFTNGEFEPDITALQVWWSRLPDWLRGRLRKRVNPLNATRIHLAHLVARHGYEIAGASYGRPKVRFPEGGAKLSIGRFCSIADGVEILLGGNHRTDWVSTYPFPEFARLWPEARGHTGHNQSRGDVRIGHDVWLGSQSMVLSGVTIGSGAVVAARSVVTRDVPSYAIVAGNPARTIRLRFDPRSVERLLALAWWNWPKDRIGRAMPLLMSGDIEGFIERG
jgi:acetyltransferase-like isoleucine patch superfamily enzyme